MIEIILAFLRTNLGKYVAGALGIVACVGAFAFQQQQRGAKKALAKVERSNVQAIAKGDAARRRSADPAARGVLDPYARAD